MRSSCCLLIQTTLISKYREKFKQKRSKFPKNQTTANYQWEYILNKKVINHKQNFVYINSSNALVYVLGHSFFLQIFASSATPLQFSPPWAGAGLLQARFLVLIPPPHLAEHFDQSLHSLHPPLTEVKWFLINRTFRARLLAHKVIVSQFFQ